MNGKDENQKLIENKIWEQKKKKNVTQYEELIQEDDLIIKQYKKVCNHFNFDFKKDPNSCNIIFNIHASPSPKVIVVAAKANSIKCRTITMNDEFTRIKR